MLKKEKIKFLGVITARGDSKGIRNKNIKLLNGKPLIYYTCQAAQGSKLLDDWIVSTDASSIKKTAINFGAKVPFMRPRSLAKDTTPTLPVLQHALKKYEELTQQRFSHIVLLQPTTPLRTSEDIDKAIKIMRNHLHKDSLVSCYKTSSLLPKKMYVLKNGKATAIDNSNLRGNRRQNFRSIYVRNSAVYIVKRELLLKNKIFEKHPLIYEMFQIKSIDIDTIDDFELASMLMKRKK